MQLRAELLDRVRVARVLCQIREFARVVLMIVKLKSLLAAVPFRIAPAIRANTVRGELAAAFSLLRSFGFGLLPFATAAPAAADLRQREAFALLVDIVELRHQA